jgi:NADPH-dependent curcumin reductase CurA
MIVSKREKTSTLLGAVMRKNKQVVLAARPGIVMKVEDFEVQEAEIPPLEPGQYLIKNQYLSMDAGFRKWMNEGADDNYLSTMELGLPVYSMILGHVIESRNPDFPEGTVVMGRTFWECYSLVDGEDFVTRLDHDGSLALSDYVSTMGPTGMTAYFGFFDVGKPQAGEDVLVSAAGGAVGSVVGQLAKIAGCRTVGISSSDEKCAWLIDTLGYDAAINYNAPEGLAAQIERELPNGFDIYFDNVGGSMLDVAMQHMKENARIVLCGAISQYGNMNQPDPVYNMWEFITKRATARGYMFTDYIEQYPAAIAELGTWMREGKLKTVVNTYHGIEQTPKAFCDMINGANRGKNIVEL